MDYSSSEGSERREEAAHMHMHTHTFVCRFVTWTSAAAAAAAAAYNLCKRRSERRRERERGRGAREERGYAEQVLFPDEETGASGAELIGRVCS